MFPEILTQRLKIIPLTIEFAQAILDQNSATVQQYFIVFNSLAQVQRWLEDYFKLEAEGKKIETVLLSREDNSLVGMVAFDHLKNSEIELRIWVSPKFQGLGLAKEACKALLSELILTQIRKPVLYIVNKENIPSINLAKSLGFGLIREITDEDGDDYLEFKLDVV